MRRVPLAWEAEMRMPPPGMRREVLQKAYADAQDDAVNQRACKSVEGKELAPRVVHEGIRAVRPRRDTGKTVLCQ